MDNYRVVRNSNDDELLWLAPGEEMPAEHQVIRDALPDEVLLMQLIEQRPDEHPKRWMRQLTTLITRP